MSDCDFRLANGGQTETEEAHQFSTGKRLKTQNSIGSKTSFRNAGEIKTVSNEGIH